jgi:Na+/melibiose symporter-like transporter
MPSEFPMNDPRNIWKDQPTEAFKMSADELRRKAQQRERKSRFEAAYSIIIGLILFVFFAWAFARAHELAPRIGFGVLSLWGIYFAYQACKRIWQGRLAPDATLNTTLQSYRSELEKRLDYAQHIWRRALMFCFLGIALVIVPALIKSLDAPRLLVNFVPFFVLLAIWCAIFFPMRKRNQRKLQQEIEELRVFERENRS